MASPFSKTCLHCRHFEFDWGEPDYSELTPGSPASIVCRKKEFDYYSDGPTLRKIFEKHLNCPKFEPEA